MMRTTARNLPLWRILFGVGLPVLASVAGCITLDEMAPPINGQVQGTASQWSISPATLELGRKLYLEDCARCHGVEPIGRYTADQWQKILPEMARETRLDEEQTAALEAYVLVAHAVLKRQTEAN